MQFEKIKNKGQAQLFQNELMENMTKTHPIVIYSLYMPVIIGLLYYGAAYKGLSIGREVLMFAIGALGWSLFEYIMHRKLFHMFVERPRAQKFVYTMHG